MSGGIDNIIKALAEDVSKDFESAKNYLQEGDPDYEKITNQLIAKVKSFIAMKKLEEGRRKQLSLHEIYNKFKESVHGLSLDEIQQRFPSIPQAAFSKLQERELTEEELNILLMDSSFLGFLQEYDPKTEDDVEG